MSEMVDNVARAIHAYDALDDLDKHSKSRQSYMRGAARAAIAAMREGHERAMAAVRDIAEDYGVSAMAATTLIHTYLAALEPVDDEDKS